MKATSLADDIAFLRERDGDDCHLCGLPIWFDAPRVVANGGSHQPSPVAPTRDHLKPVSLGGRREGLRRIKLAHRWCNQMRGNHTIADFRLSKKVRNGHRKVVLELVRAGLIEPPADINDICYLESFG